MEPASTDVPATLSIFATQPEPGDADLELRGSKVMPAPGTPELRREARALIGWMPPEAALLFLNGNVTGVAATTAQSAAVAAAICAVSAREATSGQAEVIRDTPNDLDPFIQTLRSTPAAAGMFNDGWTVRLVDLRHVCAFQPVIFTDSALQRAAGVDAGDLEAIAKITLPPVQSPEFTQSFDPARASWVLSSRNPNLRVVGNLSAPVNTPQGVVPGFGFLITVTPSFLNVGEFEGRYFLRDGYHRAFGLLSAGIDIVPAFVRTASSIEELVPPNMLPQAAYRGAHPPMLPDYLDDAVAATGYLPAVHKLITVHALELSPCG
jgi:hypothetical protein